MANEYVSFFVASGNGTQERILPLSKITSVTYIQSDKGNTLSVAFEGGFNRNLQGKEADKFYKMLKPEMINKEEKALFEDIQEQNAKRAKEAAKQREKAEKDKLKKEAADKKEEAERAEKIKIEAQERKERIAAKLEAENSLSEKEQNAVDALAKININKEVKVTNTKKKSSKKKKKSKKKKA